MHNKDFTDAFPIAIATGCTTCLKHRGPDLIAIDKIKFYCQDCATDLENCLPCPDCLDLMKPCGKKEHPSCGCFDISGNPISKALSDIMHAEYHQWQMGEKSKGICRASLRVIWCDYYSCKPFSHLRPYFKNPLL